MPSMSPITLVAMKDRCDDLVKHIDQPRDRLPCHATIDDATQKAAFIAARKSVRRLLQKMDQVRVTKKKKLGL